MRTILHISDLHFGKHSRLVADSVLEFIRGRGLPDLTIVTGDLTQRAKVWQFEAARDFLQQLKTPVLCIPGNHDVPLYNPWLRFIRPFARYDRIIAPLFAPEYEDKDIVAVGLRTNDIFSVAEGKLTHAHADYCRTRWGTDKRLRLLACHHPLLENPDHPLREAILSEGPDILLSGHQHLSRVTKMEVGGRSILCVAAGTTVSVRTRAEQNSFNWIEFEEATGKGSVEVFIYGEKGFAGSNRRSFSK